MLLNILEQATLGAEQKNWSMVNQCLRSLPLDRKDPKGKTGEEVEENEESLLPYVERVLKLAVEVLESGDFNERWEVAKIIPKLGKEAIAPLISLLEDEEAEMESRWYAGRILGEFNDPAAIAPLVNLLKTDTEDDEELAEMAAAVLGDIGSPAIEALTDLLTREETRLLAVRSLAQIRRSETITPLLEVVSDRDVAVRVAAIEALGSFHELRITPILLEALKDIAASVRKEAVIALGMRSDLLDIDLVNQLQPLLFDLNREVCQQTAIALGRLGTDAATAALFEVLRSPNTPVSLQIDIIRALSRVKTATALEYLQQALYLETPDITSLQTIWQEIVTVLGYVEQPNLAPIAADILIKALLSGHPASQHPNVKQALLVGLGHLGGDGIQPIIQMLADPDMGVKLHAIATLKKFPNAKEQLAHLATNEHLSPALKQGIAIALQEF